MSPMAIERLTPEFITSAPGELEEGVLYISIPFKTSMHLCACGCGNKGVMPIRPGAWRFTYDGEAVSMSPSVGNWSFPCRSHYWIRGNVISWAPTWSHEKALSAARPANSPTAPSEPTGSVPTEDEAFLRQALRWLRRLWRRD